MPKAKPYSGSIDEKLAAQLLNSSGVTVDDVPLGDALRAGSEHLEKLVGQARKALGTSEFTQIVADHLAAKMNRRGISVLTVSDTGQVRLEISYEDAPVHCVQSQRRRRRVPLMEELKAKAEELGVDISEFGIKRKKIWKHLQEMEAKKGEGSKREPRRRRKPELPEAEQKPEPPEAEQKPEPPETEQKPELPEAEQKPELPEAEQKPEPPETEQKPEPSKTRAMELVEEKEQGEEEDKGPMSAGPDETRVTAPPDDVPSLKRGFVKTSEAIEEPVVLSSDEDPEDAKNGPKTRKRVRPSMKQLVRDSKEVDITDLLTSEPPK
jgi:hypothetical protein